MLRFFKEIKKNLITYFELIKPKIVFANLLSATVGYCVSLDSSFVFQNFFYLIFGLFFIISCGCILNNIIDRKIDKKMCRTKNRALVKKKISIRNAFIFSIFSFFCGSFFLLHFCNKLVYFFSFCGLLVYVFLYSIILKRRSKYSTIFGSISGACPVLVGYFLNTSCCNFQCIVLFFIFFVWQIPHFYSISLLHLNDYRIAKIPVFPVVDKINTTINNMYFYVILLIFLTFLFGVLNSFNYFYFLMFFLLGVFWLFLIFQGNNFTPKKSKNFLKMLKISIFYIIFFDLFILLNKFIFKYIF
ncbi:heme o synthase [Buchnera aphidicola]|uniref:heme o synthase n=1 Tax=Buchnera aphidicola TaxID=9 RepID=UPI003464524A